MPKPTDSDRGANPKRKNGRCPKGYRYDKNANKCVFNPDSTYWREQPLRDILSNTFKIDNTKVGINFKDILTKWNKKESKNSPSSYLKRAALMAGIVVVGIGSIWVGNFLLAAYSIAVTWAIPASIVTFGLITLGNLYVHGLNYYDYKQQKKLDMDQWHLFACEIQTIIGEEEEYQIKLLKDLKKEIEDWSKTQKAGITKGQIKELIDNIDAIIKCEKNDECSKKLRVIVGFLLDRIQDSMPVYESEVKIPEGCEMPKYILTLNEDQGKIDVNDVRYGGPQNFSVPTVTMSKMPEGIQKLEERVMKAAVAEIQSCVINEITAIHDAQRRFLDKLIHKPGRVYGRNLIDNKFTDIEKKLKDVQTLDEFNQFSKFMCKFSDHKGIIKKHYNNSKEYREVDERMNMDINQIIAIRKLQVKTILDLYGSYIFNIRELIKVDYWNKALSLFEDQGVGYKGLFKKAITYTGRITLPYNGRMDGGRFITIKQLKDALDESLKKDIDKEIEASAWNWPSFLTEQPLPKLKF